jgi:Domain of unknown function (DUF4397)
MQVQPTLIGLVRRLSLLLGILILFVLPGMQSLPVSAATPSYVRIIHASPDVGTADIFVDGAKLLSSFPFGAVTGYAQLPPGPHKVQIALIGKGPGAAVITQTLAVQPGVAYTVAALGTNATGLSLDVFQDNNLVASGQAKVRVYHLSPGTGSVSVATSGNTLMNGLAYPEASNYFSLPAGSYTFNVTADQPSLSMPVATTLKVNTVTSIFAVGMINGNPKLQFVSSQVNGIPGVPGTGSDPRPQLGNNPQSFPPLSPWPLGIVALACIGAGIGVSRLLVAQRKKSGR